MSKINILSSKIYNRIAAGEVVERPFSVVKELVENSLDAGADSISIEIIDGGITSISIIDNGAGIEKSQLKNALLPHATSKISKLEDLDNIISLGFRGEALASIASVSKITIISKPSEQELGAKIYSEGGNTTNVEDCGCSNGTEIKVNNLFFNTPARAKFLHTARSEENEISATVARFILGNPSVSFKYTANGELIYQSYGDGFESAMACIYGANVISDCFYIDTERHGIKINGYISKHHFTKGNRSYQTVFLNGRNVVNQTISASISNAYGAYLMKRQYPFYVLSITVPAEIVDVNVHPNKLDVRFSNNQIIYGTIYSVISKVLDGSSEALNIVLDKDSKNIQIDNNSSYVNSEIVVEPVIQSDNVQNKRASDKYPTNFEKVEFSKIVFNDVVAKSLNTFNSKELENKSTDIDIFAENKAFLEKLDAEKKKNQLVQEQIKVDRELKFVGQVLNTFLILEDGADIYFVDQHAAHERLLFDKLNASLNNSNISVQPLLLPFVLNVSNDEYEFIYSKMSVLNKMGIEVEEFGRNSFKVSSLPVFLSEMNLQKFFDDVLSDVNLLKNITLNDLLMEKLAQKACKSAIKSGDKLSNTEIDTLLVALKDNLGLKCPHGRPVAIKITRMEIDKWFKRIV